MIKFVVTGKIGKGRGMKSFEKVVETETESLAKEKVYCLFGSNIGIKRSAIKIDSVEKI